MNGGGGLCIPLYPQRPAGGPIDFDVELGGTKVSSQIHRENPEFAAAEGAIVTHLWARTMAGIVPPMLEVSIGGAKAMTARRGSMRENWE